MQWILWWLKGGLTCSVIHWSTDEKLPKTRQAIEGERMKKKIISSFENNEPSHLVWAIIENWKTRLYTHERATDWPDGPTDYPIFFFLFCWFVVVFFRVYLFISLFIIIFSSDCWIASLHFTFGAAQHFLFSFVSFLGQSQMFSFIKFHCVMIWQRIERSSSVILISTIDNRRRSPCVCHYQYMKKFVRIFVWFSIYIFDLNCVNWLIFGSISFRKWMKHVKLTCRVFIDCIKLMKSFFSSKKIYISIVDS